MASAGRILIMPKGDWNSETEYEMLDVVSYNGKSWLAKKLSTGIEPSETNAEYWQDMFNITAENAGAIQRTIWKWVTNDRDSLFSYIKSKLDEGYTCGMIQVEIGSGTLSDLSETARSKVGGCFMCSFQRHHYGYVRATIWGDTSLYEYSNWGVISEGHWADEWNERTCRGGYLPKAGGTLTGNTYIKRNVPEFILHVTDTRTATFQKNASDTVSGGTAIIDKSDLDGQVVRTILSIQNGKLRLHKQVDGVEVGSMIIAEIP